MMEKVQIEWLCQKKEQELLNKYFGNLVKEAALERPETIGTYEKDLPLKIEKEYYDYLSGLWKDVAPGDSSSFESIINHHKLREKKTEDDREGIEYAYKSAKERTLWERITKTNHKDVTFYKGLLEEYTRELLWCLRCDFMEDVMAIIYRNG